MESNHPDCSTSVNSAERPSQTAGQLERDLAQAVQTLYQQLLGQKPTRVVCHLFEKQLAVTLEGSPTKLEKFLADNEQVQLATQVRASVDFIVKQRLISLIEVHLSVSVVELLTNTSLESGHTGMIAVLSKTPVVRNPNIVPKTPGYQKLRRQSRLLDLADC
ncbi:MAG: DUF2294 domain-containing protein [Cyanobacteria bacterium P01_A01_bin.114]